VRRRSKPNSVLDAHWPKHLLKGVSILREEWPWRKARGKKRDQGGAEGEGPSDFVEVQRMDEANEKIFALGPREKTHGEQRGPERPYG